MEVFEINFNDKKSVNNIPINIYSTLGLNSEGEIINMINIELINSKKAFIEVFGNLNFYNKGFIENKNNTSNIFSFHCIENSKYFIKIVTNEYRDIILENGDTDELKVDMLFFGTYQFNPDILNFIDKKKIK